MSPDMIGRYELRAELGRGGMAEVYLAYDPAFDRQVAIKVLPRELLKDEQLRLRFEREARYVASVENAAIVPVHDFGQKDGQPYLVMRYMPGGSLLERLEANGPYSLAEACHLFQRIAPALDHAHRRGVIHRDLKPANILFDDAGEACLTDFGIAKRFLSETTMTLTEGFILGTPAYMSPEQARGEPDIDHRTDIYSLGAILFEMLTGRLPYEAATPTGQLMRHLNDPVPNILQACPGLPAACQAVIDRSMAKRREDRYSSVSEMAAHLQSIAHPRPAPSPPAIPIPQGKTAPHPSPVSPGPSAWLRKHWKPVVFSLLALLSFGICLLGGGVLLSAVLRSALGGGLAGAFATGTETPPAATFTLPAGLGSVALVSVEDGELLAGPENAASALLAGQSIPAGPEARLEIRQGYARLDLSNGARAWLGENTLLWVPGIAGPGSTARETLLELERGLLLVKASGMRVRAREGAFQVEGSAIMGITSDLDRGRFLVDCLDGVCMVGLSDGSATVQIPPGGRGGFEAGELIELQAAQEDLWRKLAAGAIEWPLPAGVTATPGASPSPSSTPTPTPSPTSTASLTVSPTITTGALPAPTDTPRPRAPRATATRSAPKATNTRPPPNPPTKTPVNP